MEMLSNFSESLNGIPNTAVKSVVHPRFIILINFLSDNFVAGLDFDPTGEVTATIDKYGVCLISDVNTNKVSFHLKLKRYNEFGKFR